LLLVVLAFDATFFYKKITSLKNKNGAVLPVKPPGDNFILRELQFQRGS
jgi:hypothetical protein